MDGSNNRAPASCFNTASKYPDWGQALSVQCEWPILGIFVLNTEINGTLGFLLLIHFKIILDCGTNGATSFTCCVKQLMQLMLANTHSIKAPKTNRIQANIQASIAVSPSALGVLVVTVLKMLTSTRNSVTRSAILPGITSMGIRKEIHETITKRPETKQYFTKHCIEVLKLKMFQILGI